MKTSTTLLCLSLLSTLACSSGGGGGSQPKPSYLREAAKPGHLPDGTQVQPLSKAQVEEAMKTIGATAALTAGFSDAAGLESGGNGNSEMGATGGMVFGNDKALTKKISAELKAKCSVTKSETKPQVSGSSSSSSGSVYGSLHADATGSSCPMRSTLRSEASGTYSKSQSTLSMSITVNVRGIYEVSGEELQKETSVKSATNNAKINSTVNLNDRSQGHISTTIDSDAAWLMADGSELKQQTLGEIGFGIQSSSNTSGVIRFAIVYELPSYKALIQVFATVTNGKVTAKSYLNGESLNSDLGLGIALSNPAFQNAVRQLESTIQSRKDQS